MATMNNFNFRPHHRYHFRLASIGGTFEAMHRGHVEYLELAFKLADHVLITLTTDNFAQRWKSYKVSSTEERKERLILALKELDADPDRYELQVAQSQEQIEHTLMRPDVDLVVCIEDYYPTMLEMKAKRREAGIPEYHLHVKPVTRQGQRIISSTDILQGILPFDELDQSDSSKG
jgi:cytidyltransferase-like protein